MPAAPDLLVVYGTLRSGTGWRERLGVADLVQSVGSCTLHGSLFELGWYPGLVLDGAGPVVAEVLRLREPSVLTTFDRFEGFDPTQPEAGEYRRLLLEIDLLAIDVAETDVAETDVAETDVAEIDVLDRDRPRPRRAAAWVYALRVAPIDRPRVVGGDWLAHTGGRTSGPR